MPVREGAMTCSSCHNPHGSANVRLLKIGTTIDESCASCHAEKRGPYLWEHAPVANACVTCHDPHGSNNERMLVAKLPFLCQRCHVTSRHPPTVYDGFVLNNSTNANKIYRPLVHGLPPADPRLERPVRAVLPALGGRMRCAPTDDPRVRLLAPAAGRSEPGCASNRPPPQQPPGVRRRPTPRPSSGRSTSASAAPTATGDAARFERYRDLRDGAFSRILFEKDTDSVPVRRERREHRLPRSAVSRATTSAARCSSRGVFDSIPLNYSYITSTPWVEASPGVFTLDLAARQQVQAKTRSSACRRTSRELEHAVDLSRPRARRSICSRCARPAASAAPTTRSSDLGARRGVLVDQEDRAAAVGRVVRVQRRQRSCRSPLDNRTNDAIGRPRVDAHAGDVPRRLERLLVRQQHQGARLGQRVPRHRYEPVSIPAATATATVRRRGGCRWRPATA